MTPAERSGTTDESSSLRGATLVLLVAGLAVIAATWRDYGITWDEAVSAAYGDRVLDYFLSGLSDKRCNGYLNFRFYGPLADLVGAAATRWGGGAPFEARHLLIACSALAGAAGTLRLAFATAGLRAAVLATLALVWMPRFYGNAFTNPKDIPFAAAFVWAVYALVRWIGREHARGRDALVAGLAIGVALAIRPGGLPLLAAMLGVALSARAALSLATGAEARRRDLLRPFLQALLVAALAWATMIAPWPWAHEAPFAHPWAAVREAMHFSTTFDVLFDGRMHRSTELPRRYLAQYLAITTPPATLALALLGLVRLPFVWTRFPPRRIALVLLAFWAFAPLVAVAVLRPNVYDGIRHFLFLLPAFAILAGIGGDAMAGALERRGFARSAAFLVVVVLASSLPAMVRLHPYQSTYFNAFVGGVGGASASYETDYWTQSYKEAIEWVNAQPHGEGETIRILVAANFYNLMCAQAYLAPHVKMESGWGLYPDATVPEEYDYFVAMTRYGADRSFPDSPVVHVVGRDGAAFTVIKSSRPAASASQSPSGVER
jgi:hypothetical protein